MSARRLLLDTHVILWMLADSSELSSEVRRRLADPSRAVYVSAASVWEIAIKSALGKLRAPDDLPALMEATNLAPLPVTWRHAHHVGSLPEVHRDPFDRLLVAQALLEDMRIVTRDRNIPRYPVSVLRA